MGLRAHVALLLWKHLLVMRRSILRTVGEMILPFLLIPLIILIVSKSGNDNRNEGYSFRPVKLHGDWRDVNQSIDYIKSIKNIWCDGDKAIAYSAESSGVLKRAKYIMEALEERYTLSDSDIPKFHIEEFGSYSQMEKALIHDLNDTYEQHCAFEYIGGIHFNAVNATSLDYRIMMPEERGWKIEDLSEFWQEGGPGETQADHNQIPSEPQYWQTGYLSLQFALDTIYAQQMNNSTFTPDVEVWLQRIPNPQTLNNPIIPFMSHALLFLWMMTLNIFTIQLAKDIVLEKEAGIKTYMSVMGLHPAAFYASHAFVGMAKICLVMIPLGTIFASGLKYISGSLFVLLTVTFGAASIALGVLLTAVIKKTAILQLISSLTFLVCLVLYQVFSPEINRVALCMLASLNPVAAFGLGLRAMASHETRMLPVTWLNLFSDFGHEFGVAHALLMLMLDTALFALLTSYLDAVFPTDDSVSRHPLFFLGICGINTFDPDKIDVARITSDEQTDSVERNLNIEPEVAGADQADIIVHHMSKKWPESDVLAVDNLSFKAFRGQLTVLLGHNGAGKSTTFAVLTGSVNHSAGSVLICGHDLEAEPRECQRRMGYCPQQNPLFDRLTAREHLQLYAGLKSGFYYGPNGKLALKQEIDALARDLGITDSMDRLGSQLSGGQKRKLCVEMALIGDSSVVLLDEPSAGMDPEARHQLAQVLERVKRGRTILLTTHYMDEADQLGDRIGIMVKGRMACNGSPEFLKNRFGTGYLLTVVCNLENTSDSFIRIIEKVLSTIRKHSPNAHIEKNSTQRPPEFKVVLPPDDKSYYADMFEELEQRKEHLGISSFGLSLNSLEQVFLKVGELAEPESGMDMIDGDEDDDSIDMPDGGTDDHGTKQTRKYAKALFGVRQQQFASDSWARAEFWMRQLGAMLKRQMLWMWRNPLRALMPVICAICCFLFVRFALRPDTSSHFRAQRSLSPAAISAQENIVIPFQFNQSKDSRVKSIAQSLQQLAAQVPFSQPVILPSQRDLQTELANRLHDRPPMVIGAAVWRRNNKSSEDHNNVVVEALFNGIALHAPPMALSLVTNALLGDAGKTFPIRPSLEVYNIPDPDEHELMKGIYDVMTLIAISSIIIMSYSTLAGASAMPLVEERAGRFKHQLLLTQLGPVMYWLSVLVWNLLFYVPFCLMMAAFVSIWIEGSMTNLYLLWVLYFWAYVPMICCASFLFDKPQKVFAALIVWNMLASMTLLIISQVIRIQLQLDWLSNVLDALGYMLVPTSGLGSGVYKIMFHVKMMTMMGMRVDDEGPGPDLSYNFYCMMGSGAAFWFILLLLQSRFVANRWHKFTCQMFYRRLYHRIHSQQDILEDANEDEDVREERERVDRENSTEFAPMVSHLYKYYGSFPAVRNLSFGVKQEECFGLLGVNGAGKTTTFDILTGIQYANSGRATISGVDVQKSPSIGYCPQFDALPLELTGREVLTLLARLNGFSDVEMRVDRILWCIRMEQHADKLIKYYSGGQRRRVSIGLTLVTRSSLIMLDEPTAGIDPKTRRELWNLLQAIRQQRIAILLTSHSMEECEALCNRIGFMNRGALIGIGSSQHLKSRFGKSYTLAVTVKNPCEPVLKHLQEVVVRAFDAKPTDDPPTSTVFHWDLPKQSGSTWSALYRRAQVLIDSYPKDAILPPGSDRPKISDFSLTQNSLEQVFLHLSRLNETTPEPR